MRPLIHALLFTALFSASTFLWSLPIQDPPRPDAVAFCQHQDKDATASFCECATAFDGQLCKLDEPLPYMCKKQCGHAKSCHCCGLGQK